jgi:hypothetical protein
MSMGSMALLRVSKQSIVGASLTEGEHERNTESLGDVDMTKGRWITDDGVDGEWLAGHRIRSKGRLPEPIKHGSSHLPFSSDIAVSQSLPGGKQTGIWMSAFLDPESLGVTYS